MSGSDKGKWDERYSNHFDQEPAACLALQEFAHLLPAKGRALDLAAGRGGNALFLAQHGLETSAWDISPVALKQLSSLAVRRNLSILTQTRDIIANPPAAKSFDVIVVSRFLHRPLCPQIAAALRPGGLLFYQTFNREKPQSTCGPTNPDYLLAINELPQLFANLRLVAYREEGLIGDTSTGLRNESYLVAQQRT